MLEDFTPTKTKIYHLKNEMKDAHNSQPHMGETCSGLLVWLGVVLATCEDERFRLEVIKVLDIVGGTAIAYCQLRMFDPMVN